MEHPAMAEERVHLSEDQIDDHLIGDLNVAAAAHLAGCEACAQRVARAEKPLENFRDVTMAWSERRSATMPMPSAPVQELVWQRRTGWAMASFVLVVGFAAGGAGRALFTMSTQTADASATTPDSASPRVAAPAVVAVEAGYDVSPQRVSEDNRMLKAIDQQLDATADTPAALGLEPVSEQTGKQQAQPALED
jgi:hypothetical protein